MLTVSEFISSMFIFYVGMVLCMGSIGISFEGLGVFEKHLFSPSFFSASSQGMISFIHYRYHTSYSVLSTMALYTILSILS